jgi:hypothetical protein
MQGTGLPDPLEVFTVIRKVFGLTLELRYRAISKTSVFDTNFDCLQSDLQERLCLSQI